MAIRAKDQVTLAVLPSPSYVRTYYLLQASGLAAPAKPTVNPPAAPWTTTEPSYTEGSTNTLYTVMLTAYGSVAFTYGDVQKSSSYEAAKSAYNKALAAQSTAANALTVANGKVSLGGLGVTSPPTTGHVEGNLILLRDAAGRVNSIRIMNASSQWVSYTLLADQILVPGSLGTISLADNTVTAPKVVASEALLAKLLVRQLTAGEIDVQDLVLSGLFRTSGYDEGNGVLINDSGVTVLGNGAALSLSQDGLAAGGGSKFATITPDGRLIARGASLTDGELIVSDGQATTTTVYTAGFETASREGWLDGTVVNVSTEQKHSGSQSLKIPAFGTGSNWRTYCDISNVVGLISVSMWVYLPASVLEGTLRLRVAGNTTLFDTSTLNAGWNQISASGENGNPSVFRVRLDLDVPEPLVTDPIYIDDVVMQATNPGAHMRMALVNSRAGVYWINSVGDTLGSIRANATSSGLDIISPTIRLGDVDLPDIRGAVLGSAWLTPTGTTPTGIAWDRPLRYRREGAQIRWEGRPYRTAGWSTGKTGDPIFTGLPTSLRPDVPSPLVVASDLGSTDDPSAVLWPDGSIRVYGNNASGAWPWLGGTTPITSGV